MRGLVGGVHLVPGDPLPAARAEAPSVVGVFVEDRADVVAGERHEAVPQDLRLILPLARRLHLGGDAEAVADRGDVGVRDAAAAQRGDERLLHLEDALGRERGLVQAPLVDVVVDLRERDPAVVAGGEVDLPGVVFAGRDLVEVVEREFGEGRGGAPS